jgi:hypothetical protein
MLIKTNSLLSACTITIMTLAILVIAPYCNADDLDDGIPIDDKIEDYDKLTKDQRLLFRERHARTRLALREEKDTLLTEDDTSWAIQGSIILGPGAKTGDIILIYEGNNNNVISK